MNELAKENQQTAFVVLADIRDSRLIADRHLVQDDLRELIRRINQKWRSELEVPFSISGGDEIQGLLTDPAALFPVVDDLDLSPAAFRFRFGVGWGAVTTGFADRSWEMDGGCFHAARQALGRGKQEHRWVTLQGLGPGEDRTLNAVFRLMQVLREGWTDKQRTAVKTRRTKLTQTIAAAEMGLDKSTLSKMLKAARYKELLEMENVLGDLVGLCLAGAQGGRP